jgi:branched-chain amino acid aminotransferase
MRIYVEEKYTRAAPGGVGFSKNAGNYGASMHATALARKAGYDQVLWTDAFEHKYLQEVGTMNVFFIIGNTAVTPSLEEGTILAGVTRDSAITVLEEMGLQIDERRITIDELMEAHKAGQLREVFGTGTAATISMIKELRYKDYVMEFDVNSWQVATELKTRLNNIRYGVTQDTHGWMYKI